VPYDPSDAPSSVVVGRDGAECETVPREAQATGRIMDRMVKPIEDHSDQELKNVIENHRRHGKVHECYYLDAMEELARRKGQGLDFRKSFELIRKTATERRFMSYKDLADASGADWSKVRYAVNTHLGDLILYAHGKGWPMLSAVVVNQPNVATGAMEPPTLKGFVEAARSLGYVVTDEEKFLRDQQERVFEWAAQPLPAE
jgi:hypothetical protein